MLHRMPAGAKLVIVIFISGIAFLSVYGLAASATLILAACACARIPPRSLLKGSKPLAILAICLIVLKTISLDGEGVTTPEIIILNCYMPDVRIPFISKEGFIKGLVSAAGLFAPFAAAALLFSVTTMRELRLSLGMAETFIAKSLFRRRNYTPLFSLGLSLMLGFIPRFFEMWEAANLACDSRSCKRGLRRLFMLLPLVTERMIEASANTALALEARGYGSYDEE